MPLPVVAIVGRPNVGKSSLLNALVRRRIAIVEPTAGVTRDRVSVLLEHRGRWFELVDTGGMEFDSKAKLAADITRQIEVALTEASVVVFVTDVRDGPTPLDDEVAARLRKVDVPVVVAANKADGKTLADQAGEFYAYGFEPVIPTSAKHRRGRGELLDAVVDRLPAETGETPAAVIMKLAVVGKRNAGKSTLINALAGCERVIVSEIPGTTRDAVDIRFEKDGHVYVAIDTAGVRKKKSLQDDIEFYSLTRALGSIRRADVVLFLIDATTPVSRVDKKLGHEVETQMKPVVLVVNKWDRAKDRATTGDYADYLTKVMPGLSWAPLSFTTAKDAKNVEATIDLARALHKQARTRVPTSRLNAVVAETLRAHRPPSPTAKLPKVYFATQVAVEPPTIVFSVNDPSLFGQSYRRFIENRFRDELPFPEVPLRLIFRPHREDVGKKTPRDGYSKSRLARAKGRPGKPKKKGKRRR